MSEIIDIVSPLVNPSIFEEFATKNWLILASETAFNSKGTPYGKIFRCLLPSGEIKIYRVCGG